MDLETELKKLLGERAASNEQPMTLIEVDVVFALSDWSPAPWHRDAWRQSRAFDELEGELRQAA